MSTILTITLVDYPEHPHQNQRINTWYQVMEPTWFVLNDEPPRDVIITLPTFTSRRLSLCAEPASAGNTPLPQSSVAVFRVEDSGEPV